MVGALRVCRLFSPRMTSPSTRFLLTALLLLGQLAGLLHALEHPGGHGSRAHAHAASLVGWHHRTDHAHVHAHEVALSAPAQHAGTSDHGDGTLCGECLLAAANAAMPGVEPALRTPLAGDVDVAAPADIARLAWRSSAHRARGATDGAFLKT